MGRTNNQCDKTCRRSQGLGKVNLIMVCAVLDHERAHGVRRDHIVQAANRRESDLPAYRLDLIHLTDRHDSQ